MDKNYLEKCIKLTGCPPAGTSIAGVLEAAKLYYAQKFGPVIPLPREECLRIRKLDIRMNEDGTFGYSSSGMLPDKEVARCLGLKLQEPEHKCTRGHDLCHTMYPCAECPCCEPVYD